MKKFFCFAIELREKVPDPSNTKENYQSFIRKRNTQSEIYQKKITQQPTTYENRNIVGINLVITEHPKL